MNKILKLIIIIGLLITIMFVAGTIVFNYNIKPDAVYEVSSRNIIDDPSFENGTYNVGDCCTSPEKASEAKISLDLSSDAFEGLKSLNLKSDNHCACINKQFKYIDKSSMYLIYLNYKGDKPEYCVWVSKDNKCIPKRMLNSSENWKSDYSIIDFSKDSESASLYLYANSNGFESISNYYDNIEVNKLIKVSNNEAYKDNIDYIIKTNPENIVKYSIKINDQGYYLVTGKPEIIIKFPIIEILIIISLMMMLVRIIFIKAGKSISSSKVRFIQ